jgi:hypothetical protein
MKTKATLLLAAILAAGSAAAQTGEQVNSRNPNDTRAFDVMETDQGPPTAADRQYAKPKHKKHKKHRSAETQPYDASSMGASGTTGVTGSGLEPQSPPPPISDDLRNQPDREVPPNEPRIDRY